MEKSAKRVSSPKQAIETLEKIKVDKPKIEKIVQANLDLARTYMKVFSTKEGLLVLDNLAKYSHKNFPNYDNVNATFSKIGEQQLVDYINAMIKIAKRKK